jgi:hypothetical protein
MGSGLPKIEPNFSKIDLFNERKTKDEAQPHFIARQLQAVVLASSTSPSPARPPPAALP